MEDGDGEEQQRSGRVPRRGSLRRPRPGGRGQVAGEKPRRGTRAAGRGRAGGAAAGGPGLGGRGAG